jgi:hypothetical protein
VVASGVDDLRAGGGLEGVVVQVGVLVGQDGGDGLGLVLDGEVAPSPSQPSLHITPGAQEAQHARSVQPQARRPSAWT